MAKPRFRVTTDGVLRGEVLLGSHYARRPSAGYMGGTTRSPFLAGITPALRDPRDEVRAVWTEAAARAIAAAQNSGWIAGGVDQATTAVVGTGLRLNCKPDTDALGWDPKAGTEWARLVERRWEAYACNPLEVDASGKQTFGQIQSAGVKQWFGTGEVLAWLPWIKRSVSQTRTKVLLLPSHRLVQETNVLAGLVQGVWMDSFGLPVGYRLRTRSVNEQPMWVDMRARDTAGRPNIVHVFDGLPQAARGITPLAPALRVVRQFDQLSDATLTNSLIQAIFAATVESDGPTEHILHALQDENDQGVGPSMDGFMDARGGWYEKTNIDLGAFGKIAHLFPGEKLNFHASASPSTAYEAFAKFLLREVARCLGLTFEDFTGDYTGATYSSVRMATSVNWPIVLYRRFHIAGRLCQPVYESWLEEEIDAGRVPFPGGLAAFAANRPAAVRADWRGTAKPQADDLKTAKALEVLQAMGVVPDEWIANELGLDIQDVYEARAREQAERERLGIKGPQELKEDALAAQMLSASNAGGDAGDSGGSDG